MPAKKEELNFEEAMKRLEAIVKELEDGEVPLEKSLQLFEEGSKLVQTCNQRLNEAEQKVTKILLNANGEPEEAAFQEEASEI